MAVTTQSWLDAQHSVLGSVLISPELAPKVLAETALSDFSGPCQNVYSAIKDLFNSGDPVDVVAVAGKLGGDYSKFLAQLMAVTPTAAHIDSYITLCRSRAKVLQIQQVAADIITADSMEQIRPLMDQANSLVVQRAAAKVVTMRDALAAFADRAVKPKTYLPWPIPELNDRLYSEPGDLMILAGRPSTGKSAFSLQCAATWAVKKKHVGFFSLETNPEKLFDRFVANVVGLSMSDIKRNQLRDADWQRYARASAMIAELPFEIIPAAGMSVTDVKAYTQMRRYDIIIVDYLQLLRGNGSSRYEQVTNVSLELHLMAQSMGVSILALSQLSRAGKDSGRPTMASLRESGQIEQDADLIFLLSLDDEDKPGGPRVLDIAKNKEGTCPAIKLDFDGQLQRFSKANATSEVVSKYSALGKQARRANSQAASMEQMQMLPNDAPIPEQWREQ